MPSGLIPSDTDIMSRYIFERGPREAESPSTRAESLQTQCRLDRSIKEDLGAPTGKVEHPSRRAKKVDSRTLRNHLRSSEGFRVQT
jgi:hypothetical protein